MSRMYRALRVLAVLAACIAFTGCSDKDDTPLSEQPPEQIYRDAEQLLNSNKDSEAAELFEELERLHPYSEWAKRGTIMAAYAYNRNRDFDESRAAAERFLSSHPGDPEAAYAQYLVAMSYFDQLDKRGRDRTNARRALVELKEVVSAYGDSDYAKSAKLKIDLVYENIAAKEMEVGRFYLKRGNYASAINRFREVVAEYGSSSFVPEALHRQVEAYLALGLEAEAREAVAILGYNFRGSEWYAESYRLFAARNLTPPSTEDGEGLLQQVYRRTIKGDWL